MSVWRKILIMLIVLLLLFISANVNAQNADVNILKGINPQNPDSRYWSTTSRSVYWLPAAVAGGTMLYGFIGKDEKAKYNAYELFLHAGAAMFISEAMKYSLNRTRPADKYPGIINVSSPVHGQSFPSGHTATAFATATTLSMQYRKWYVTVPAFLWAGSVGYSRMYKGYHYPSDVLAGAITGAGSSLLLHWLNKSVFKKR